MSTPRVDGVRRGSAPHAAARRHYLLTLLFGAAGGGLVLLAVRETWAHVLTRAPAPLPATIAAVSGQSLVPAAEALGVAALAGLAAVIATRGTARRVVGCLLILFGLGIVAAVSMHLSAADVVAAAHSAGTSQAGSVTGGSSGGAPGAFPGGPVPGVSGASRVVLAAFPWRVVSILGAAMVAAAGAAIVWRGARWPGLSSRYEPPVPAARTAPAAPAADAATMWESLTRGVDPTEPGS